MSPGPHSAKAMPGIFRISSALASAYLSSSLTPSRSSPFGLSGHGSALSRYSSVETPQIAGRGRHAVDAAPSFVDSLIHSLFVERESYGFDEGPHRGRRIRMAQQDAVDAGGEHLREHPGIGADRRLVDSGDRHVDDHGRRAMAALGRTALRQPAHVVRQPFDVERGVLHVVADVVGEGLGVFLALFEGAGRAGMRAGVIDRLTLFEKLDRPIDAFRFCLLGRGRWR